MEDSMILNLRSLLHKKYRGHFEIVALLLEAIKDNGTSRFSIVKYVGTNYKQLEKYLNSVTEIGFIEINKEEGQCLYRITEKGLSFLRQYYILLGMFLGAFGRGNLVNIVQEVECDLATVERRSPNPFVAKLRYSL